MDQKPRTPSDAPATSAVSRERARALATAKREAVYRRTRRIRHTIAAAAVSLFLAAFAVVYVQLVSGHDPALTAAAARRSADTRASSASTGSTGTSTGSTGTSTDSTGTSTASTGTTTSTGSAEESSSASTERSSASAEETTRSSSGSGTSTTSVTTSQS